MVLVLHMFLFNLILSSLVTLIHICKGVLFFDQSSLFSSHVPYLAWVDYGLFKIRMLRYPIFNICFDLWDYTLILLRSVTL